jgi:SEC-C motif-containing protein
MNYEKGELTMEPCPCGSGRTYDECCEPVIKGDKPAETAEALMRARYSAHVKAEIDFIQNSTHSSQRSQVDRKRLASWIRRSQWLGLEIISAEGGPDDTAGAVEFVARYREKEKRVNHHEIATFTREDGQWYFQDGKAPQNEQYVRPGPKVGRNDPCPCGSQKKYKKCCAT